MESQLSAFENYVTSLTNLGVYPTFNRHSNGWTCFLRNAVGKQLMPLDDKNLCWGENLLAALTTAVDGLNSQFLDPKDLRKYIDTGIDPRADTFQAVKTAYAQ